MNQDKISRGGQLKTILVVDDEKRIRRIYTSLLTAEGYSVLEASNADDANELIKNERIDLILLDLKMPETDGSILYEVIRSFHRKAKVIIASVYSLIEQHEIIHDALDYYDKSQGIDILLAKVKKALEDEEAHVIGMQY